MFRLPRRTRLQRGRDQADRQEDQSSVVCTHCTIGDDTVVALRLRASSLLTTTAQGGFVQRWNGEESVQDHTCHELGRFVIYAPTCARVAQYITDDYDFRRQGTAGREECAGRVYGR